MPAKQVIVKKTTRTWKKASTATNKKTGTKGQKRCPSCGKYM